jgi:hypothetical protein
MTRFQSAYAKLVDRLVGDLVALERAMVEEELRDHQRALEAKRREVPKVSPALKRALERAEVERLLAREQRTARKAAASSRPEARRPGPQSAALGRVRPAPPAVEPPVMPAPLFVHKRSRDGSIQNLERNESASAPPPA